MKPNAKTHDRKTAKNTGGWSAWLSSSLVLVFLVFCAHMAHAQTADLTVVVSDAANSVHVEWGTESHNCSSESGCVYTIPGDATVTLTAHPSGSARWMFEKFDITGGIGEIVSNPFSFQMGAPNRTAYVDFKQGDSVLTINKTGAGTGTVTASAGKDNLGGGETDTFPAYFAYLDDGSVTLTANPDSGFTFGGWSGDLTSTNNPDTITIDGNKSVTVRFNAPPVANDDSYTAVENTILMVPSPGVLGNDTDADDVSLTASVVTIPSNGTVLLNPNGMFSYSPTVGFTGTDSFTYRAYDGLDYSNVATVTITVEAVPQISLDPGTFSPTVIEGNNAVVDTFRITNTGTASSTLNYSISDNVTWLSVAPDAGALIKDAYEDIEIIYSTAGLPAGTHEATITVNDGSASNSPQTITVSLTVNSQPTIELNPISLTAGVVEGNNAADQTFTVTNTGTPSSTLNYTITTSETWLSVAPDSGALAKDATADITVVYNTAALAPGNHSATITVSDPSASNNPQTVTVGLTVQSKPVIVVDPTTLSSTFVEGRTAAGQTFSLTNDNGGGALNPASLTYTISEDSGGWISSVSPAAGALGAGGGATITVAYDTAALASGNYSATITVSDDNGDADSATVTVSLTVMARPVIAVSPGTLESTILEGESAADQTFTLSNGNGTATNPASLTYTISEDSGGWISSVGPAAGTLTAGDNAAITVAYNTGLLIPGDYSATITVSDDNGDADSATVTVNLTVQTRALIGLSPDTLSSVIVEGNNASSQSFTLSNDNGGETNPADLTYTISEDSGGWIASITPNSGTLAGGDSETITVVYNTAALIPDDYTATITVSDLSASNNPQTVTVGITVESKPVIVVDPATLSFTVAQGYNPPSQTFTVTNDNGSATNPASLTYSIADNSGGWIASVSPNSGTLAAGGDTTITVAYDTASLAPGDYTATITVSDDKGDAAPATVTVTMRVKPVYILTINWIGAGTGTVQASAGSVQAESPFTAGSDTETSPATVTYECMEDDIISLSALASDGSIFKGFDGDKLGNTPLSVTMDGDKTVEVEFRRLYTLTVNWVGAGSGTVDVSGGALMPGSPFEAGSSSGTAGNTYTRICEDGDVVSLAATAAGGSIFKGFDGDKTGATPVSVTVSSDTTVEVEFRRLYTLTVNWIGGGTGAVGLSAHTLMPGSPFEAGSSSGTAGNTYTRICEDGDTVSLTGTPLAGSEFQGFNGDDLGTSPISILVTGNTTVTAHFSRIFTLRVTWTGVGTGTVTASDNGGVQPVSPFLVGDPYEGTGSDGYFMEIDCLEGDVIRLEATDSFIVDPPTAGSRFKGWGGHGSGSAYSIDIAIDGDKEVTADFNATYTLEIRKGGTGAFNDNTSVTAGTGSASGLPGGNAPGVYLYEWGDEVSMVAADSEPTRDLTGSRFDLWTHGEEPGTEFGGGLTTVSVTIADSTIITGYFTGKYMIWADQRPNGTLSPPDGTVKFYGESQTYTIVPSPGFVNSDVVVDGFSLGPVGISGEYTFTNINANHEIVAIFVPEDDLYLGDEAGDLQIYKASVPPMVLLVMGRDHKLYYEAYNDASDLNGDGVLDVGYNPSIDYYGYFDSRKVYTYSSANGRFEPLRYTANKRVNPSAANEWSGDFLNYLTMSRIDVLRRVLYGGYRSIDTATETELMRSFIPQDAHSWGKEYTSVAHDGYNIREYTPLDPPPSGRRHLFANTTLRNASNQPELDRPRLRVLTNSPYRIWQWVSIERPVAGTRCVDGGSGPNCEQPAADGFPASVMTDYTVKVLVAVSSMPEANCKKYPSGNYKPVGLLQKFGEVGKMNFGLMTGSYEKNLSGGVLRKRIGSITDEIDLDTGQFKTDITGIIGTIDRLRITQFRYNDYSYQPGWPGAWVTTRPMNEGEFKDWGNPIAEMMYEGLRYFAGKEECTPEFDYTGGVDAALGLPKVGCSDWDDPFAADASRMCAKPFMLVISDINPNYDSDQLPGANSNFGTFTGSSLISSDETPVAFNAQTVSAKITSHEEALGNHYIGQVNDNYDGSCAPKDLSGEGFGDIRGLCPEEPTKQGSYYSAAVAHFGRAHKIGTGAQNVLTYAVALASPLPRIEIRVGVQTTDPPNVTLVPFGKSVGGCLGIDPDNDFHPTNTIVDFYVQSITSTSGSFRINYEDVEQGADHDMDAIVLYTYQVLDSFDNPVSDPALGTKVRITLNSEYSAGCIIQHMGYIISGTNADGTYLEVRTAQHLASNDVNFFLDTPPPGYPHNGLPLTATRDFTPGATTAATLLKDPLWYAAKWGGFNDLNNNGIPDLESEWDAVGDGVPDTYFYVVNPLKLEEQLTRSFIDILSRGTSHVAPVVSVDEANRTQSGDKVYMAFFKPMSDEPWQGNLKKYGLEYLSREGDCGRPGNEWTIVDQFGEIAGECDGTFKPSSRSFWSTENDGGSVDRGGAGGRLLASMPGTDPVLPPITGLYWDFRNIYTYMGDTNGAMAPFHPDNEDITNALLNVATDQLRHRIMNFIYGYSFDAASNGDPIQKRSWILGDMVHSEPRLIDYLNSSGELTHRYVVVGANDGMLHVFADSEVTIDGKTYQGGDEILAFIPPDLLTRLQEFSDMSAHRYMVDGPVQLVNVRDPNTGTDEKTLVFGLRRGGKSYWALDATSTNPLEWTVKWSITGGLEALGGTPGFKELGQSWSRPTPARLRTGTDTIKNVVIFAGGYDIMEDGFPEAFNDVNDNGIWDEGEPHAATPGGTEFYDYFNPDKNRHGRGIFVVDIDTGEPVFKAIYGEDAITTGTDQKYPAMKYCFPADISVISLSYNEILMYAADVYGNIWKITYNYFAEAEGVAYDATTSKRWKVKHIFQSNPGSTMQSGVPSAFASATLDPSDTGRKTFYSPAVSLFGNDWTTKPVLYFGTGDREHPRYRMISNRFYVVADTGALIDETDLLNLSCNELDVNADANGDGFVNEADWVVQSELADLLFGGQALGFYRALDQQGACSDAETGLDYAGQHVLSKPTLFFGNVYFTAYQPTFDDPCEPLGNAWLYALDFSFGTSTFNYNTDNDYDGEIRNLADSYRVITGTAIPSAVRVITREGHSAGLVSVGGAVAGVGEDGSTTIPGPPGGITPILWETE